MVQGLRSALAYKLRAALLTYARQLEAISDGLFPFLLEGNVVCRKTLVTAVAASVKAALQEV